MIYDPEDFWVAGGQLPHDGQAAYLRFEEKNSAGVYRPLGAILIVPPPALFSNSRPILTVSGTAPNIAATATGVPPAGALYFVLPKAADYAVVVNPGGNSMFISFSSGLPELEIPSSSSQQIIDGISSEVWVRGEGGICAFTLNFALMNATVY